jgi:O-antigen/teichoic acid export membrane protein
MSVGKSLFKPSSNIRHRLIAGIGANALGKGWVLLSQLITVPLLIALWGIRGYGTWLMLTTLPTYIALSDFGFGSAAAVVMIRRISKKDHYGALSAFQSVWLLITAAVGAILVLGFSVWAERNTLDEIFGMARISTDVAGAALWLLVYAFFAVQMSILSIGYRSTSRYAQGTILLDLLVPLESIALLALATFGARFSVCAFALMFLRIIGCIIYYTILQRQQPWLTLGWSHSSWNELRDLYPAAIASLGMPVTTAFGLQGVLFVVGLVGGPAAAGMFGAVRTVTRLPMQLASIFSRATLPELTLASSSSTKSTLAILVVLNVLVLSVAVGPFVLLAPLGPTLIKFMTHDSLPITTGIVMALTCDMALQSTWNTFGLFIFAENKQQTFVPYSVFLTALGALSPLMFTKSACVIGTAITLCCIDFIISVVVFSIWKANCGLTYTDLWSALRAIVDKGPFNPRSFNI